MVKKPFWYTGRNLLGMQLKMEPDHSSTMSTMTEKDGVALVLEIPPIQCQEKKRDQSGSTVSIVIQESLECSQVSSSFPK